MTRTITAVYENGLLKPLDSLDLPECARVLLTVETEEEAVARAQKVLDLARKSYAGLSEEEIAAVEAAHLDETHFFFRRG
jgi:predicted DNA-binding antitoxin AbrB/MazE fold protein